MLPNSRTSDGALRITTDAPPAGGVFVGGVALAANGDVCSTDANNPDTYVNGVGVTNAGALCVDPGGTVSNYLNGLPVTAGGRLVVQLNQPVSAGDSFVGGLRVGPLGGLYIYDDPSPPPPPVDRGFGDGFDGGFG